MGYATDGQYFYVYGGQDLNKGFFDELWRLNMLTVRDNIKSASWELMETRGDAPHPTTFHCMFVF